MVFLTSFVPVTKALGGKRITSDKCIEDILRLMAENLCAFILCGMPDLGLRD